MELQQSETEKYLADIKEVLKQKEPSLEHLVDISLKQERLEFERKS